MDEADEPKGATIRAVTLTPQQRLAAAREAYQNAQFAAIRPLLLPILEPEPRLTDEEEVIEARTLLAVSAFFEAQQVVAPADRDALTELAREQFLAIMLNRPDHDLDDRIFPASVVDLYSDVRLVNTDAIEAVRKARGGGTTDSDDPTLGTIYFERGVRERYYALNFAPFGIGQFQNGDEIAGTAFALLQGAALVTNVTAYFVGVSLIDPETGTVAIEDLALARQMQTLQISALATFAGLWLSSSAYAVYNYEQTEFLQIRTLDAPPPELVPQTSFMLHFSFEFD